MSKKSLAKSQVLPVEAPVAEPRGRKMKKTLPLIPVVEPIAPAATPRRPRAVKQSAPILADPVQTDAQIKMAHVRSFKKASIKSTA